MSSVDAAVVPSDANLRTDDQSPPRRERFRGDIQGLRALAVLAVVLNHANFSQVSGGYAGVDVFFVISGFLITDHLARRLASTGRIGFADFYARRARRILPAAFTVIALTFVVVMVALPVSLRVEALHDAIASAAYVPNYVFAHRATNYFANPTPSLFQHYWSLGVEEQFYLVWPLLLLAAWWSASRLPVAPRWRARAPRIALLLMAIVIGLVSFLLEQQAMKTDQPRAFFSAQTRAWEFAVGALVALVIPLTADLTAREGRPRTFLRTAVDVLNTAPVRLGCGWIGLAGIVLSFFLFDARTSWPGTSAALPVVCTASVILAGSSSAVGMARLSAGALLSLPVLVWIGGISYSLYLVHWPILQLVQAERGYGNSVPLWENLLLAAAGVPVAWALTRFVENPLRGSARLRPPSRALIGALAGSASLVMLGLGLAAIAKTETVVVHEAVAPTHSLTDPPSQVTDLIPSNVTPTLTSKTPGTPLFYNGCITGQPCYAGDPSNPRVLLFGDSIGASWWPALAYASTRLHFYLESQVADSCAPGVRIHFWGAQSIPETACDAYRLSVLKRISQDPPSVLVIAEFGGHNLDGGPNDTKPANDNVKTWLQGLGDVLAATPKTTKIVIIHAGPTLLTDEPSCLEQHPTDTLACAPDSATALNTVPRRAETMFAAEHADRVHVIDLDGYLCGPVVCPPIIGNTRVWMDSYHLTAAFSRLLGPPLAQRLQALGVP